MIALFVDSPSPVPSVRSDGTPTVVGGAFANAPASTERMCHRGTANTRPCEPPASTTRSRIATGEALPDVFQCLAFLSQSRVARFTFSTLACSGAGPTAQTDGTSPTSESPGTMHALSCLGNSATFAPNARSRTAGGGRFALRRVPNVAPRRARSKLPHLVHTGRCFCTRVRQERRMQPPLLASFDARTV